ncbi:MAG: rhomboid family intramembrane serine protease [Acidobacteriota bacterium]
MQPDNPESSQSRVFRLCQRCGRPTPTQSAECVSCGARSLPDYVSHDQARAEQIFARAYFARGTPVTFAILGFNLLVYLLMTIVAGGDIVQHLVFGVDPETLIAFGAKTNELLGQRSEWFRLVTPIFIHGGLIHIVSNSYALWIVGPQVERLYGSARFLAIYLLCGIGGVVGSYLGSSMLGRDPGIASVGASGAIFGLFGMLAVFGYKYRHELPQSFRKAFGSSVFPVIAINLLIGFSVPVIDNGAHIGGLICGAILAFVVPYIAPGKERTSKVGLVLIGVCVLVVGYSFVRAVQQSSRHLARRTSVITPFLEGLNAGKSVMTRSMQSGDDPAVRRKFASELSDAADQLADAATPDARSESILRSLGSLLREQRRALEEDSREVRLPLLAENARRYAQIDSDLRAWVASEGAKLGIVESKSDQ